ncbi:hypothetical protein DBA29_14605 [Xenophilus aerolatus]|nr:hypothetical protein [Xenophilus aerolatus]
MISLRQRMVWAGVLASAAFAASAQTPPPSNVPLSATQAQAAATSADAKPRMERKKDFAQRFERMQQHRAQRLAALKDKLQLSAQQQGAWTSYTTALQPPAMPKPEDRAARRAEFEKLTTPERIDRMQARQAERSAMFAKRADATKAFYAQLTPAQQKTFDAESLRMGPRGHGHHGHRPHGEAQAPTKG